LSLKRKGYTLIVVTNQPDVARGVRLVGRGTDPRPFEESFTWMTLESATMMIRQLPLRKPNQGSWFKQPMILTLSLPQFHDWRPMA